MKKYILIIACFIASYNLSLANNEQQLFDNANKLYQSKKYEQSIKLYNQILDKGLVSAKLYYNLGNAEYRIQDFSHAILHYERALRLAPNDNDIQDNLALAQSKTTDNINSTPKFFLSQIVENVKHCFSLTQWAVVCIILMLLVCVACLLFFISGVDKIRKISFYSGIALIVVLIISIANTISLNSDVQSHSEAIIITPAVSIKSSPDNDSAEKFILHEGTKLYIEDQVENWTKIHLADGNTGWIENSNFEII